MTKTKLTLAAALLAAASPAAAGQPNTPGFKGDVVTGNVQSQGGKAWGDTVSRTAKGETNEDRNVGEFLGDMADHFNENPNPANDKGKGND